MRHAVSEARTPSLTPLIKLEQRLFPLFPLQPRGGGEGKPDGYVKLKVQGQEHETHVEDNTYNPIWDEMWETEYSPLDSDLALKVKVFDSNLLFHTPLGDVPCNVATARDQSRTRFRSLSAQWVCFLAIFECQPHFSHDFGIARKAAARDGSRWLAPEAFARRVAQCSNPVTLSPLQSIRPTFLPRSP